MVLRVCVNGTINKTEDGSLIIAIPHGPYHGVKSIKGSLRWQVEERFIIERHGFITYPGFLDNGFVAGKGANIKWLEKNLKKYGYGLVRFAVAPDNMPTEAEELRQKYDVDWIYPLHSRDEDFSQFEWVGMPQRDQWRDYDLNTFLKITEGKKRWYLGYWDSLDPMSLLLFDGFDTRIPFTMATKYCATWDGWGKSTPAPQVPFEELMEYNLLGFKMAIYKLLEDTGKQLKLTQFDTDDLALIAEYEELEELAIEDDSVYLDLEQQTEETIKQIVKIHENKTS